MAKKFKIKEAELLDDQIKEQSAPESTVIPATPEEVSQATDNANDTLLNEPTATDNNVGNIETPEGSASVSSEEVQPSAGNGIEIQPETVSIDVQVPVQQLGQAVAMATGDVRTAELSPDLEAEKAKQAEEIEKQPMVATDTETSTPGMGNTPSTGMESTPTEVPTVTEEPQPVQESLEHTTESTEPDTSKMGASYRDLMELSMKKNTRNRRKNTAIKESSKDVDPKEMGASFRALQNLKAKTEQAESNKITEDLEENSESEDRIEADKPEKDNKLDTNISDEPESDESKEKLDFKTLKANKTTDVDSDNVDLPRGLAETDDDYAADLGFENSEVPEYTDISDLFADTLEDKSDEELDTAAETLGAAADVLSNAATAIKGRVHDDSDEEDKDDSETLDFEDVANTETKEDTSSDEKLDFQALLNDSAEDEDDYEEDEEIEESLRSKSNRLRESFVKPYQIDYQPRGPHYCGLKDLTIISHGEWSDPEIYDARTGLVFNYYDIEDPIVAEYRDEGYDDEDDETFINYVKNNADFVYDTIDYLASEYDEAEEDFDESRKRVPCKLPVKTNLIERKAPVLAKLQRNPRFNESKKPLVKKASVLTESAKNRLHTTSMADRVKENVDINSIIFPKGSEDIKNLYFADSDNLVSAHERVLEARKKAILDFHRTMNESRKRPVEKTPRYSRYKESIREVRPNAPSTSRFNEALRSSVKTARTENADTNSWVNNRAIEKYEESQKFNFKELLENGYLG